MAVFWRPHAEAFAVLLECKNVDKEHMEDHHDDDALETQVYCGQGRKKREKGRFPSPVDSLEMGVFFMLFLFNKTVEG